MRTGAIRVLVVEDNPGDMYLINAALGFGNLCKEVAFANDGEEALQYLDRKGCFTGAESPDLILLDLNLPKLDGRQVLEHIKRSPELRHIPVVVLSTSTSERDIVHAYENHANCYLSKPADLDQYLDIVTAIESYWCECVTLPAPE